MYCYSFSVRGQTLWRVLLVHAAAGFVGTLVETAWIGAVNCGFPAWAWLLAVNEVNWVLHESSPLAAREKWGLFTVYYSYIKTMVVVRSTTLNKVLKVILLVVFAGFVGCRANIGRLRYLENQLMTDDIELAHNYAFMVWGTADLVLMVLLVLNVIDYARKKRESEKDGVFVVQTLLNSSIPRFAVIFLNTIITPNPRPHTKTRPLLIRNATKFAWMVKGTYPTLLLLDILMTRFLLYAHHASGSAGNNRSASADINPLAALPDHRSGRSHPGGSSRDGASVILMPAHLTSGAGSPPPPPPLSDDVRKPWPPPQAVGGGGGVVVAPARPIVAASAASLMLRGGGSQPGSPVSAATTNTGGGGGDGGYFYGYAHGPASAAAAAYPPLPSAGTGLTRWGSLSGGSVASGATVGDGGGGGSGGGGGGYGAYQLARW
ncbi:hypothetical protein DFJ73DRAFT_960069 [Zopfochytrium polystomum]|nr:hypothetical protein DFJ73DRAFT_960069 [Zopfochytrium polystomum]